MAKPQGLCHPPIHSTRPRHEPAAIVGALLVGDAFRCQLATFCGTERIMVTAQATHVQVGPATGAAIQARQRQQHAGQAGAAFPADEAHATGKPDPGSAMARSSPRLCETGVTPTELLYA